MKRTLLFAFAMMAATICFAQQQFATLNHNDTITAYYGESALQQALSAADSGSVITLSSGLFVLPGMEINGLKNITIRGNGMVDDIQAGTTKTIISSGSSGTALQLGSWNAPKYQLHIEGICFNSAPLLRGLSGGSQFKKCYFERGYWVGSDSDSIYFINCDFSNIYYDGKLFNSKFINCIIRSVLLGNTYLYSCNRANEFINCIINFSNNDVNLYYQLDGTNLCYSFSNCIMYTNIITNQPNNTSNCFNCIGIGCSSDSTMHYFSDNSNNNRNYSSFGEVFKYFAGTYSVGMDMSLLDSIATNVLGTDGTQVGVYGGMVPYEPRVNTPRYVRANVAPHTTLDGKLSVDIEVVSE